MKCADCQLNESAYLFNGLELCSDFVTIEAKKIPSYVADGGN
jgi:hypothetical protein